MLSFLSTTHEHKDGSDYLTKTLSLSLQGLPQLASIAGQKQEGTSIAIQLDRTGILDKMTDSFPNFYLNALCRFQSEVLLMQDLLYPKKVPTFLDIGDSRAKKLQKSLTRLAKSSFEFT